MRGRRVLAELRRHLLRGSLLRIATGSPLLVAAMGLLAALTGDGLGAPTNVPYLFAPALACPLAAQRVVQDRETGAGDVLATTPLTRREAFLARTLAVFTWTPVAVLVSLPVLYACSLAAAPGAFIALLDRPLWALSIGTTAASVGLLVGHLTPERPRLGLGLAFGVVLVWFLLATVFGDTANPPLVFAVLRRSSPLSYAIQAIGSGPILVGTSALIFLPLTLAAWALALAVPVSLGLQHASSWRKPPPAGLLAITLVILAVGAAALVPWSAPETASQRASHDAEGSHGDVWASVTLNRFGSPNLPWSTTTAKHPQLTLVGPPNATLALDRVELQSPVVDFDAPADLPDRVTLDRLGEDRARRWNASGGLAGTARLNLTVEAQPKQLFNRAPTDVIVSIEGQERRYELAYVGNVWKVDAAPVAIALATTALPMLAATRWLPGRWNAW